MNCQQAVYSDKINLLPTLNESPIVYFALIYKFIYKKGIFMKPIKRQVALHIDVTGTHDLDSQRVVRMDALELVNAVEGVRQTWRLDPEHAISKEATAYHGLRNDKRKKYPKFNDVVEEFLDFIQDAQVVMHASFTHHVLNFELDRLQYSHLRDQCESVTYA